MKNLFALSIAAAVLLGSTAGAAEFANPVIAGDYPDPSVIRVDGEYWATATTSEWAPIFPLLRSRDLVNWDLVGTMFSKRPDWSVGNFWAPEIQTFNGQYYCYYIARKRGGPLSVAVATAPKPAGPWTDHGPMVSQEMGSIDAVAELDEHGDRYLLWKEDGNSRNKPTPIWAQKLSKDGLRLEGEMKELFRNDQPWEGNLVEGPFVVRRNGFFYMFYSGNACCGRGCNYGLGVARAKSLLGPWEKHSKNPILAGTDVWKCPGHGSIVTDAQGRDWLMYHCYSASDFIYVGRQALLDEVKWEADGWPSINGGRGPSRSAPSPHGATAANAEHKFSDEFTGATLNPHWQWPQNNQPVTKLDTATGELVLSPTAEFAADIVGAVLAIKTTVGNYDATTAINTAALKPGVAAGLSAYGDRENALGLVVRDGKLTLWRRQRNKLETISEQPAPAGKALQVRMTASAGHRFQFEAKGSGADWQRVGGQVDVEGNYLPPWDRGIRVALTVGGGDAPVGRFDWLKIQPVKAGAN